MKKGTKKKVSKYGSLVLVFGLLLGGCGILDMKAWEIIAGVVLAAAGGAVSLAFDPSVDEPWHVKIDE